MSNDRRAMVLVSFFIFVLLIVAGLFYQSKTTDTLDSARSGMVSDENLRADQSKERYDAISKQNEEKLMEIIESQDK